MGRVRWRRVVEYTPVETHGVGGSAEPKAAAEIRWGIRNKFQARQDGSSVGLRPKEVWGRRGKGQTQWQETREMH